MGITTTISRLFSVYDRKDRETNRSWSGFGSTTTSRSTNSSYPTCYNEPPQIIHGSWVDGAKLRELLNEKFGSEYKLETRSDNYKLFAKGRLTNEEIMWCTA
ncbi:hypothetical protein F4782DRAFT_527219 [Xylaria castorea]|nr:hypothetical protein F4782DRAFT_527219 [Xylaria castorea]